MYPKLWQASGLDYTSLITRLIELALERHAADRALKTSMTVSYTHLDSAQEVAQIADIVLGAVKPGIMTKVLGDIASSLNKGSLVVSIAAGVTLDQLARALGHDRKIIRAMPNTPSLVRCV